MGEGIGKILKPAFEISRILGNIKTWIEDLKFLNLKGGLKNNTADMRYILKHEEYEKNT